MSELSGQYGLLSLDGTTAASTFKNWKINPKATNPSGAASNTGGGTVRVKGILDHSGSADFDGKSALGFAVPGTIYSGYFQTQSSEVSGSIIVDSVTLRCDIEGGGIIGGSINFSGNGALTYANSPTSLTNSSLPQMFPGAVGKASWQPIIGAGTLGSAADIPDVRTWELTISCTNKPFASSGTGGYMKRVKGIFDAKASMSIYQGALGYFGTDATLMTPGNAGVLKLYVAGAAFYTMTYGMVSGISINEDIEGASPVSGDLDFDWSAYTSVGGVMTKGTLVDPLGNTIY